MLVGAGIVKPPVKGDALVVGVNETVPPVASILHPLIIVAMTPAS